VIRKITLRQVDGSVGATLPRHMVERLNLAVGNEVFVVETDQGILITPYDPSFEQTWHAYKRTAARYRNALRELANKGPH
jgi:antitoxin component of MazEF toxin-antitoxin module